MNNHKSFRHSLVAMLLGTIVALSAFTARAEDQQQIVVIQTFDVHANATGFIEMLDKGIKMAKKWTLTGPVTSTY